MNKLYREALKELQQLTLQEKEIRRELHDVEGKLKQHTIRVQSLTAYLQNEINYGEDATVDELKDALKSLFDRREKELVEVEQTEQPKDSFNKANYILQIAGQFKRKTFTSGDVLKLLHESEEATRFDEPGYVYAALSKFVARGVLSKQDGKFKITAKGQKEIVLSLNGAQPHDDNDGVLEADNLIEDDAEDKE